MEYTIAEPSASVATIVVTAVLFSELDTVASAEPPFELMTGELSLRLVSLTFTVWLALVFNPSLTLTNKLNSLMAS